MPEPKHRKGKIPRAEIRKRIKLASTMLMQGYPNSQIKATFYEQFSVSYRSVERYLSKARAQLRAQSGKPPEDHIAESLAFYTSITRDTQAPYSARLRARENIDRLLGLRKPFKIAATDAAGNDLPADELQTRRERVAQALEVLKQRASIRNLAIGEELGEN
jgi:ATP/maltotriose-dependent transcriptional regulator MalT